MTNPNPSRRPTHTMDARHPRALFPALVPTDSRPTIGSWPFRETYASTPWPSRRLERVPSSYAVPPIWGGARETGSTAW